MELSTLQSRVEREIALRAVEFGLAPGRMCVEYVLNPGGFVHQSFRITDGRKSLHLKLVSDPADRQALRRWQGLHELLERSYNAPPMVGWIGVPGTDLEGPLFE